MSKLSWWITLHAFTSCYMTLQRWVPTNHVLQNTRRGSWRWATSGKIIASRPYFSGYSLHSKWLFSQLPYLCTKFIPVIIFTDLQYLISQFQWEKRTSFIDYSYKVWWWAIWKRHAGLVSRLTILVCWSILTWFIIIKQRNNCLFHLDILCSYGCIIYSYQLKQHDPLDGGAHIPQHNDACSKSGAIALSLFHYYAIHFHFPHPSSPLGLGLWLEMWLNANRNPNFINFRGGYESAIAP